MARTIVDAVREVCLSLPDAEEFTSHGAPNFRAKGGKVYAILAMNHHGDGRVALWLKAPEGSQAPHVGESKKHFFVPPYVGVKGWLGVNLDSGLAWSRIAALVYEAYAAASPAKLVAKMGKPPKIAAPDAALAPESVAPLESASSKAIVERLRKICLALPETTEARAFGNPVFKCGAKTFASAYDYGDGLRLSFWCGVDRQGLYCEDPRYTIPPYMGHNGWIALAATSKTKSSEIESLALASYRHFALKRMLAQLGEPAWDSPLR